MNTDPETFPRPFTHRGELVVAVWGEELDLTADLLSAVEDWLLHAETETLDDLNTFPVPDPNNAQRLIAELGETTARLRHLAKKGICP